MDCILGLHRITICWPQPMFNHMPAVSANIHEKSHWAAAVVWNTVRLLLDKKKDGRQLARLSFRSILTPSSRIGKNCSYDHV